MPTKDKTPPFFQRFMQAKLGIRVSCVAIVLLLLGAIFLGIFPPLKPVSQTPEFDNFQMTDMLANGAKIQQTFISPIDADSFGIYYNNYDVFLESGYLDITVSQDSSEIFHQSVSTVQLNNSQFFYLDCPLATDSTYTLTLAIQDLDPIDRASFMITNVPENGSLIVNSKHQDADLILSYVYHTPDYFAIWYCVFGIVLLAIYIILFINREVYEK